jgi:hypothetical protein
MAAIELCRSTHEILCDKPVLLEKFSNNEFSLRDSLFNYFNSDLKISKFSHFKTLVELFYPYEDIQKIYNFWYRYRQCEYFNGLMRNVFFYIQKCDKTELLKQIKKS